MCIIIAKNKSDRLPTISELKHCFNYNHDGAGFMYTSNNKVVIDKGYMNEKSFIKHFKKLCKNNNDFKNKSLVIHCRIGTAGTNSAENTHPYPLTNNISVLHKTNVTTDIGIAHNGVMHEYQPTDKTQDINDTQFFIKTYLYNLYSNYKMFYKNKEIIKSLEILTNSKLAILDKDDNLALVGDFTRDNNLSFSNSTYKPYECKYTSYYKNYETYTTDYWKTKETTKEDKGNYYEDLINSMYEDAGKKDEFAKSNNVLSTFTAEIPQDYQIIVDGVDVYTGSDFKFIIDYEDATLWYYEKGVPTYLTSDFEVYDSQGKVFYDSYEDGVY